MRIEEQMCDIQISDRYSAIIDLEISGNKVELCFSKIERPDLKQRVLKNLVDAYEMRIGRL